MDQPIGGMRRSRISNLLRQKLPDPLADSAKHAARLVGTATASRRPLPDFLVIGTKKGGTTSVANWLVQHPQVVPMFPRFQRHKSPHYFDINFHRGEAWYRSHFPTEAVRALHARKVGTVRVGEASPYYMFHPAAADRIAETVPNVRLIAVLREPVSRAHSNYYDRVVAGTETLPTFEAAVDAEESRLAGVTDEWLASPGNHSFSHDHHTYLARGRYAEQLRRYFDRLGRESLLVLPLEALKRERDKTWRRIEEHVGLDHHDVVLEERNVRQGNPKIDPATRERLAAYYEPYNRELADLLGEEYGW
jgi:Sulfotransferase domain